jgi:hypothetical protein
MDAVLRQMRGKAMSEANESKVAHVHPTLMHVVGVLFMAGWVSVARALGNGRHTAADVLAMLRNWFGNDPANGRDAEAIAALEQYAAREACPFEHTQTTTCVNCAPVGQPESAASDRDALGRATHEAWVDAPRDIAIRPRRWEDLSEADKEECRHIGERLFAMGAASVQQKLDAVSGSFVALAKSHKDLITHVRAAASSPPDEFAADAVTRLVREATALRVDLTGRQARVDALEKRIARFRELMGVRDGFIESTIERIVGDRDATRAKYESMRDGNRLLDEAAQRLSGENADLQRALDEAHTTFDAIWDAVGGQRDGESLVDAVKRAIGQARGYVERPNEPQAASDVQIEAGQRWQMKHPPHDTCVITGRRTAFEWNWYGDSEASVTEASLRNTCTLLAPAPKPGQRWVLRENDASGAPNIVYARVEAKDLEPGGLHLRQEASGLLEEGQPSIIARWLLDNGYELASDAPTGTDGPSKSSGEEAKVSAGEIQRMIAEAHDRGVVEMLNHASNVVWDVAQERMLTLAEAASIIDRIRAPIDARTPSSFSATHRGVTVTALETMTLGEVWNAITTAPAFNVCIESERREARQQGANDGGASEIARLRRELDAATEALVSSDKRAIRSIAIDAKTPAASASEGPGEAVREEVATEAAGAGESVALREEVTRLREALEIEKTGNGLLRSAVDRARSALEERVVAWQDATCAVTPEGVRDRIEGYVEQLRAWRAATGVDSPEQVTRPAKQEERKPRVGDVVLYRDNGGNDHAAIVRGSSGVGVNLWIAVPSGSFEFNVFQGVESHTWRFRD